MRSRLARHVVARYLEKSAEYDARYVPPKGVVGGVEAGVLPEEVLNIWKYVVEQLGTKFHYVYAMKYWRNKCAKMGIVLPSEYIEGMGGEGSAGRWGVASGEQIEDWVKATMESKKLVDKLGRSIYDWTLYLAHYQDGVRDAQEKIAKHRAALEKSSLSDKQKKRHLDWLKKAESKLEKSKKDLEKAQKAIDDLKAQADRHKNAQSPTIEFEKEFQFMVLLAMKEFDKKSVIKAVEKALDRVERSLDIPDSSGVFDVSRYEGGYKTAGLFDSLRKVWDKLANAWHDFLDWTAGILRIDKKFTKLMDAAGA